MAQALGMPPLKFSATWKLKVIAQFAQVDKQQYHLNGQEKIKLCLQKPGTTIINHNITNQTVSVDHCEDPGCHITKVIYNITDRQIKALIDLSTDCGQIIQVNG
jgi:hypothetical protein